MSKKIVYKGKWVYNWFSNMEIDPITIDGITYPAVENYYQGMKSGHPKILKLFSEMTPSKAKFNGRHLDLREDITLDHAIPLSQFLGAYFSAPFVSTLTISS